MKPPSGIECQLMCLLNQNSSCNLKGLSTESELPNGQLCLPLLRIRTVIMSEHIVSVTDDTFKNEVLEAKIPVLVDYWAEWCGPCKTIAKVLDEIASEYAGRLKIAKLNIDENPGTPPKYGIRGIPTLILFKNGEVEATKVGALIKSQLATFIDSNL